MCALSEVWANYHLNRKAMTELTLIVSTAITLELISLYGVKFVLIPINDLLDSEPLLFPTRNDLHPS
jgi:hypothetical protein